MGSSIPAFPLESQSFSKRVDQQGLQEGKLKIPKIAVRKYGKCMAASSVLFLKVPNGGVWPIGLKLCAEGRFWLQEGWPRLANFYSLDHGYTLRFKCQDESSCFLVRIFDSNDLEIDYPLGSECDDEKPSTCLISGGKAVKEVAEEAQGLAGKKKLLLLDPSGKPWDVNPTVMQVHFSEGNSRVVKE